jgi:hypothetical protein
LLEVWMALIAEVTLIVGAVVAVPPVVVLVQLTELVPDGPDACSGNDAVWSVVDVAGVSMLTDRVSVLEPTVSVHVTVSCWAGAVASGVTVTDGLAKAR